MLKVCITGECFAGSKAAILVYFHIAVATNCDRIDKTICTHEVDANFEVGDVGGEASVADLVFV